MNASDSELIKGVLSKESDFALTDNELEADVILLNTCAVRENAHRKVFGAIHEIRHKRDHKPAIYGILGCMATNLKEAILEDGKLKIDLIAGPDSYRRLPELIKKCTRAQEHKSTSEKQCDITLRKSETYDDLIPKRESGVNAWITVMRGCDNFCTFCVVPYTRGRERSRSPETILKEARKAAEEGFPQVTLLGQNVNSYKYEGKTFVDILRVVGEIDGIKRIRFTAPHPKDFPDELIDVVAHNKKVCKQIHLPLQAGNDRILELMNRTYTQKHYLQLVEKIRKACPQVALSTDIIVGFPTETDAEFEDTLKVVREVEFDSAFMFKYSERKDTIATRKYKDDVPAEKKTERIVKLNDLQRAISLKKNQAHIGQTLEILIESLGTSRDADDIQGRMDGNKIVILKCPRVPASKDPRENLGNGGPWALGHFINVQITAATPHALQGKPVF